MSDGLRLLSKEPTGNETLALLPRRAPRLAGVSVDGYGALRDLRLDRLDAPLTVLLGPNETGKSTLFDFLTAVLFDFPRKSDERFRAPLGSGPHGGRVVLADSRDAQWVVERHAGPAKHFSLTRPDGLEGSVDDLAALLGGTSREIFRTVFAVDLDDLRRVDGMTSDEVREVLFSSSILGQRRSASQAIRRLDARRDALVKPRAGGQANLLFDELRSQRSNLTEARRRVQQYSALSREADAAAATVAELRTEEDGVRARLDELATLERCWDASVRRSELAAELGECPNESEWERFLVEAEGDVSYLASELSGHKEKMGRHSTNLQQQASLTAKRDEIVSALGGDWAPLLLRRPGFDAGLLTGGLEPIFTKLDEAVTSLELARRAHAKVVEQERALTESLAPESLAAGLEERARLLEALCATLDVVDRLEREERHRLELLDTRAERTETNSSVRLVSVGAFLLAAIGGFAIAKSHGVPAFGAALCALALALFVVVLVRSSRPASRTGSNDEGLAASELDHTRRDRDALVRSLGLETVPSLATARLLFSEAESNLRSRAPLEETRAILVRLAVEVAQAEKEVDRLGEKLSDAACRHGIEEPLGPSELRLVVPRLSELSETESALSRLGEAIARNREELESYERLLLRLFERTNGLGGSIHGLPPDEAGLRLDDVAAFVRALSAESARLRATREKKEGLRRGIEAASGEITRALGGGRGAETLRSELAEGDVMAWRSETAALRSRLSELQIERDEAVREHERMKGELRELGCSSEIAELELRCSEIEEAIRTTLREYLRLTHARGLIEATLKRYEAERQPAVLEKAASHFDNVTGGRYVRLVVNSAPDGTRPTVRAIGEDGMAVDASELSRGAREQLYLCLRLALAESFAEQYVALPIVLDDVLVNFDPVRQERMIRELDRVAKGHQVVLLTCHPHMASLVGDVVGPERSRVVEFAGRG